MSKLHTSNAHPVLRAERGDSHLALRSDGAILRRKTRGRWTRSGTIRADVTLGQYAAALERDGWTVANAYGSRIPSDNGCVVLDGKTAERRARARASAT